ncbi:hypothetical protein TNCV_1209711 [Trichonephila clavipes]|nr:hypothetical protein TNCV_1209711 [Trichonephila clavipes]
MTDTANPSVYSTLHQSKQLSKQTTTRCFQRVRNLERVLVISTIQHLLCRVRLEHIRQYAVLRNLAERCRLRYFEDRARPLDLRS